MRAKSDYTRKQSVAGFSDGSKRPISARTGASRQSAMTMQTPGRKSRNRKVHSFFETHTALQKSKGHTTPKITRPVLDIEKEL